MCFDKILPDRDALKHVDVIHNKADSGVWGKAEIANRTNLQRSIDLYFSLILVS